MSSGLCYLEQNFQLNATDIAYVTLSDTGLFRNEFLSWLFFERPVVVDAFAGSGFDTMSMMYNLYYQMNQTVKRIYAVENKQVKEADKARIMRLQHNIKEYIRGKIEGERKRLIHNKTMWQYQSKKQLTTKKRFHH